MGVDIVAKMALIENFKKIVANYIYLGSECIPTFICVIIFFNALVSYLLDHTDDKLYRKHMRHSVR